MKHENSESLSYKFQRLRERLREAIASGELSGKLPGERVLAKQFQVNAKTLSKALTDLAAEGVLDRSIGRGTYVKGQAPAAPVGGRWLVLADADSSPEVIAALREQNDALHVMSDPIDRMRPSFLNQFTAVVDLASDTPDSFLRDLVVRNMAVVAVGREPKTYSMNAVVVDSLVGASRLVRKLLLDGHRKFAVATERGETDLVQAVQQTAKQFDPNVTIDAHFAAEVPAAAHAGATAVICDSIATAKVVMHAMTSHAPALAIAAVGTAGKDVPCSGVYVTPQQIAAAVADLLAPNPSSRPSVLWLAGEYQDRGTTAPATIVPGETQRPFTAPRPGAVQA